MSILFFVCCQGNNVIFWQAGAENGTWESESSMESTTEGNFTLDGGLTFKSQGLTTKVKVDLFALVTFVFCRALRHGFVEIRNGALD